MNKPHILLLPGWQNSGEGHWQTLWEQAHGCQRVEQHDWQRPLRGDWVARLEEVVLATPGPLIFAAHSLGCLLVAAWASHSAQTHRVRAALLVAPGDAEQESLRPVLRSWSPIVRRPLPFASRLVASRNDPYCTLQRAQGMARDWGSDWVDYGERGHINAQSGLGLWPEGFAWVQDMMGQSRVK